MTWLVACELSRWRTAKLSNRQGEFAQETPPTVKSSSWWLTSADAKLAPLSEEKTLPQGECITAFVCYQFEIKCPCVLKPGVGNYLLSAKLVITVTRSALRLPVSNPLLQPTLAWPSLSFLKRARRNSATCDFFLSCPPVYSMHSHFYAHETLYTLFSYGDNDVLRLTVPVWSKRTYYVRARAHALKPYASERDSVVKCQS